VIPRGTAVSGRVVTAKAWMHQDKPGYLRLTLLSISPGGKIIPVETSSIFVKGAPYEKKLTGLAITSFQGADVTERDHHDVILHTVRPLIFRLSHAAPLRG